LMRPAVFTPLRRRAYEDRLLDQLRRYDVGFVVLEGQNTWTDVTLAQLTRLNQFVRRRLTKTHSFGYFQVLDIRSGPSQSVDAPVQQRPSPAPR